LLLPFPLTPRLLPRNCIDSDGENNGDRGRNEGIGYNRNKTQAVTRATRVTTRFKLKTATRAATRATKKTITRAVARPTDRIVTINI
jgi:hypothetical protein